MKRSSIPNDFYTPELVMAFCRIKGISQEQENMKRLIEELKKKQQTDLPDGKKTE